MPRYTVTVDEREYDITLEYFSGRLEAVINGEKRRVLVHKLQDTRSLLLIDNRVLEVDVRTNGAGTVSGERIVFMRGREIPVTVEDYSLAQMRKTAGISSHVKTEKSFVAPMPGLVVDVRVEPGQQVNSGDPLVVIEAMKMENVFKAKSAATVKAVLVTSGQSVEKGDTLVEFE
ncbi:MAG: biotin/lipoyl-binding protein [candidate division Zixibacteria bacterium]|nr:biotin/lipoyl-binding protein [candidate division Zixibacteria bacterium]